MSSRVLHFGGTCAPGPHQLPMEKRFVFLKQNHMSGQGKGSIWKKKKNILKSDAENCQTASHALREAVADESSLRAVGRQGALQRAGFSALTCECKWRGDRTTISSLAAALFWLNKAPWSFKQRAGSACPQLPSVLLASALHTWEPGAVDSW